MPRTISARVNEMDITKIVIPAVSVAIAAGGYMATITAVADDTKNIDDRLRTVEVVQAENKSQAAAFVNLSGRLANKAGRLPPQQPTRRPLPYCLKRNSIAQPVDDYPRR